MNYRHAYHAGGFADVVKHVVLTSALAILQTKPTALTYLDVYAGKGLYPLASEESRKKKEYETGIEQLLHYAKTHQPSPHIAHYLNSIAKINLSDTVDVYPGSPLIAQAFLRPQDKAILCELHPEEYRWLKKNLYAFSGFSIHCLDAYLGMKAFLPPKTPRGFLLIDPPFEKPDEFEQMTHALTHILKHWRQGPIMVWYPIKSKWSVQKFQRSLEAYDPLFIDFSMKPFAVNTQLSACGIALINPPWKIKECLETEVLPYLAAALEASWRIYTSSHAVQTR